MRVNGEEIPESAVQYELDRLVKFYSEHMSPEQIKEQMNTLRNRARQQAIGAKLLIEEAERMDIKVPAAEIESKLQKMITNAGGKEAFERILKSQNLTMEIVSKSIEQGRQVDMLIEKITEEVPDPTEDEMKAHFKKHTKEYARPDRAQARHILIKVDSRRKKDRETARSKLLEIRRQIEEGANFADMAAVYSDCPSGKKTGGSLGWFSRGMMIREFDETVFLMEVGKLSDVVESKLGFHLIFKTGHKEGSEVSYEEVSEKVREFLRHSYRGETISAHVNELMEKAVIESDS